MEDKVHKILLELDYKYDIDTNEYFNLTEEEKSRLTSLLVDLLIEKSKEPEIEIEYFIFSFQNRLEESILNEQFEEADIYKRVLKVFDDIKTFNIKDWKQE